MSNDAIKANKEVPVMREVSNRYSFGKDGKTYWGWGTYYRFYDHLNPNTNYWEWLKRRRLYK
jgi:hypothetical protein